MKDNSLPRKPGSGPKLLGACFFNQPATSLAISLLGKVLRHRYQLPNRDVVWLAARIIETEAYEITDRGSHSSLGYTPKRKAMFMKPGTVYMYYARGRDSLNFSSRGEGNAVLIKSGFPYVDCVSPESNLAVMQSLHQSVDEQPRKSLSKPRKIEKLCNGQTLLCKSLNLKVSEWDTRTAARDKFRIEDVGLNPVKIIQCTRLGIPPGRDQQLKYRFVDFDYAQHCTRNPLTRRDWQVDRDYFVINSL
ncbi:MAG: DNA-3-methyladenine glycosylase [bacterium]|nr:DNA-3-methyladenine glycosylase [Gammaproteobacteria bacterium]HIL96430.1 DNA-3-methyladenine glycosylase [Pseudomonadales bacterium]